MPPLLVEPVDLRERPPLFFVWASALRLRTLPAALAPVLIASAMAYRDHAFHAGIALAAWLGATCLQAGANLYNDFADFGRGADRPDRLGPTRATAAGWLSPRVVRRGAFVAFGLATLCGSYLMPFAPLLLVTTGLLSIGSAILYTAGPYALAYTGWGDVFAFVFFGPVAVGVTYALQAGTPTPLVWIAASALGALVTAILIVNNLRDRKSDAVANKKTWVVRFGPHVARVEYTACIVLAYIAPAVLLALDPRGHVGWLAPALTAPRARYVTQQMWRSEGRALNAVLGQTAQLALIWSAALAAGLTLEAQL